MKRNLFPILICAALFPLLIWQSEGARSGALAGAQLWAQILLPSLLPYFAAAGLLQRLGLPALIGRALAPAAARLFGVSGEAAAVFLLGLTGGYPLGAASAAELGRSGALTKEEGEHLLSFCDNTGPAFAVGALGAGVFGSALTGFLLWLIHAGTAVLTGVLLSIGRPRAAAAYRAETPSAPNAFSEALTGSVKAAVTALLSIGGYVIFFSALLGIADSFGMLNAAAKRLSRLSGVETAYFRALLGGMLELSNGIGAMRALPCTPLSLALGSFLLGWGGLCVHWQALAVTADTHWNTKGRLGGKLLHGVLSAICTYILASLIL